MAMKTCLLYPIEEGSLTLWPIWRILKTRLEVLGGLCGSSEHIGAEKNNASMVQTSCQSGNCTFPEDQGVTLTTLDPNWNWWDDAARVGKISDVNQYHYFMLQSRKTLALRPEFDDLITLDFCH
ncbi:hypothetical protein GQ53DRAFT_768668 [Thozetella sp. PMI_491]|nr:hypothetical protein GQ53DRAFT_768668 [Thozetella sp. PMI_491]